MNGLAEFQHAAGINVVAFLPLYRTVRDVEPDLEPVGPPFLVPVGPRNEEARVFRVAAKIRDRRSTSSSTAISSIGPASTARTPWTTPTTFGGSPFSRSRR